MFREMLSKVNYSSEIHKENLVNTFNRKFIQKMDLLYAKTEQEFRGTIILPIIQGFDPRLGSSDGECLGYVNQWSLQILQNKNPFGIDIKKRPPFKPMKFISNAGCQYFYLNHLAIFNSDII